MAVLPLMQFRPDTKADFNQQSGFQTALGAGSDAYRNMLQNQILGPQQQNALDQQLANLQASQIQNQYMPGQMQAQTNLAQARAQQLQQPQQPDAVKWESTAAKAYADIAQAKQLFGEDSPRVKELEAMVDAKRHYQEQTGNYREALTNYMPFRNAPPGVKEQIISHLQSRGIPAGKAVQAVAQMSQMYPLGGDSAQPQQAVPQGGITPGVAPGATTQSPMQQVIGPLTPEEQQLGREQAVLTQSEIQKRVTSPDQQKRAAAGSRFNAFASEVESYLPEASSYFGTAGKVKLEKDKAMAALTGSVSPGLQSYQAMNNMLEGMKGEAAIMLNIPADQISRSGLSGMFDPGQYSTNPKVAQKQLQKVIEAMRKAEPANIQPLFELAQDIRAEQTKTGQPSSAAIPSFSSKAEYDSWAAKATPEQISELRRMHQ